MSGCIDPNVRSINVTDLSLFQTSSLICDILKFNFEIVCRGERHTVVTYKTVRLQCLLFFVSIIDERACLSIYPDRESDL